MGSAKLHRCRRTCSKHLQETEQNSWRQLSLTSKKRKGKQEEEEILKKENKEEDEPAERVPAGGRGVAGVRAF